MPQVESIRPLEVNAPGSSELTITNRGTIAVFYGDDPLVSSANKTGTLAAGESLTIKGPLPVWLIAEKETGTVELVERDTVVLTANQSNVFARNQAIEPVSATGVPLTIASDSTTAHLRLANVTSGQTPAKAPVLVFMKDGTDRWQLGIDVQAGSQGDLFVLSKTAAKDVVYITDEANPGMAIGAVDRTTAQKAQLRIVNLLASRCALEVVPHSSATKPTAKFWSEEAGAPFLECRDSNTETLRMAISKLGAITSNVGLGVWGHAAPAAQHAEIAEPAETLPGHQAAIKSIREVLKEYGITA